MPYGSENYEVKGIAGFEQVYNETPINNTMSRKAAEARAALFELREMMNDAYIALFCNPLHEPEKIPDARCLNDELDAVEILAKAVLSDFTEMKKRMV